RRSGTLGRLVGAPPATPNVKSSIQRNVFPNRRPRVSRRPSIRSKADLEFECPAPAGAARRVGFTRLMQTRCQALLLTCGPQANLLSTGASRSVPPSVRLLLLSMTRCLVSPYGPTAEPRSL